MAAEFAANVQIGGGLPTHQLPLTLANAKPESRTHMEILYLLLPLSVALVLLILGVLGWSVYRGQFDDLDQEGVRILEQDPDEPTTLP